MSNILGNVHISANLKYLYENRFKFQSTNMIIQNSQESANLAITFTITPSTTMILIMSTLTMIILIRTRLGVYNRVYKNQNSL